MIMGVNVVNNSKLISLVLIVLGFGIALIAGLWFGTQLSTSQLSSGGALIGAGLAFIPVALLLGSGLYLFVQGNKEKEQVSEMQQQRKLMDMLRTRGEMSIGDAALELQVTADHVKGLVQQLVGLQVFSGYINWDKNMMYALEASKLRELNTCKNCGGELKLAGKGTVQCRFCGTEYFLP
jgi:hypothetical protein